ncbi:MAG TPA: hypothetical protein V6C65_24715 [Allocoleopsis sp.]
MQGWSLANQHPRKSLIFPVHTPLIHAPDGAFFMPHQAIAISVGLTLTYPAINLR